MKTSHLTVYPSLVLFLFLMGVSNGRGDLPDPSPDTGPVPQETAAPDTEEVDTTALVRALVEEMLRHPRKARPLPPEVIDEETLWLARCIYSETKRPEEQELVAWIVRNRVETAYRGKRSYRGVVLDPYQFSAFNPGSPVRRYYIRLQSGARMPGWQRAMAVAYAVRHAPPRLRPFSHKTRHFYSERSMRGSTHPDWAVGMHPVTPERPHPLDARRFRFYEGVL